MLRPPLRLIGRDAELARLTTAIDAAASGQASFQLLLGEAGIGKSALLAATAELGTERGLRVLAGSAVETGGAIPYLPLVGPLSTAVDDAAATDVPSATVRAVVRGAPVVADPAPHREDAAASAGAARFIEAVYEVLVRRPTLLIVDDVHWADGSTVTVLEYLSRRAGAVPLAVVAAARDDEPDLIDALSIADGRRFERIDVHRLDRAEVGDQVAALLGGRQPSAVVDRLFERSAGNPMFVEELLGADDQGGEVATGASKSAALRALVLGRVGRLSPPARAAIEALAVIGRPADEELIGAVAGLDEEAGSAALRDAIRGGVATTIGQRIDVRHPIVGEVVAGSIAAVAARRLHRRAAEALDGMTSPGMAGERARHWSAAGDDRRAWAAFLEAADEAARAFAFAETAAALRRAIDTWPAGEPGLAQAMARGADADWMSGDSEAALELALRARTLVAELAAAGSDYIELAVELDVAVGRYAWDVGDRDVSIQAFIHAGDRLGTRGSPALRARVMWGIGRGWISERRLQEAYDLAIASTAAASEGGAPAWEAEGWLLAGMCRAWSGENGITELRRGLDIALACGDPGAVGHGYLFLVDMLGIAGRRDESLALAMEGIRTSERLGIAETHGSDLRGDAALLLIDRGRWPEADAVLEPADPRAIPSLARALLAIRRGDLEVADDELVATTIGPSIGGRGIRGGPLELARAELAWARGDRAAALRELDSVGLSVGVWSLDFAAWRALWCARLGAPMLRSRDPATRMPRWTVRWRRRSRPSSGRRPSRRGIGRSTPGRPWAGPTTRRGLDSARPRPASRPATGRPPAPRSTKRSGSPTSSEPARSGTGRRTSRDGRASWLVRPAASPPTRRSSPRGSGKSWCCSPRAGPTARSPRRCSSARRRSRSTCRGSSTSSAPRPAAKPWRSRADRGSWARPSDDRTGRQGLTEIRHAIVENTFRRKQAVNMGDCTSM